MLIRGKRIRTAVVVVANVTVDSGVDSPRASELKKTSASAGAGTGTAQTLLA